MKWLEVLHFYFLVVFKQRYSHSFLFEIVEETLKNGKPMNQSNYAMSNSNNNLSGLGYASNQNKTNSMLGNSNNNSNSIKPPTQAQQQSNSKPAMPLGHQRIQHSQPTYLQHQQQSANQNLQAQQQVPSALPVPQQQQQLIQSALAPQPPPQLQSQPSHTLQPPPKTPSQAMQQGSQPSHHQFMQYPTPVYSPTNFPNQIVRANLTGLLPCSSQRLKYFPFHQGPHHARHAISYAIHQLKLRQ